MCAVDGCDREVSARGWCAAHYYRWRKHGDVQADKPIEPRFAAGPGTECKVVSCARTVLSRGWCAAHYRRWRRHGSARPDQPLRVHPDTGVILVTSCVWLSHEAGRDVVAAAHEIAVGGGLYLIRARASFIDQYAAMDELSVKVSKQDVAKIAAAGEDGLTEEGWSRILLPPTNPDETEKPA